eukprot:7323348-Heterocapsa_arctica.AAC.1
MPIGTSFLPAVVARYGADGWSAERMGGLDLCVGRRDGGRRGFRVDPSGVKASGPEIQGAGIPLLFALEANASGTMGITRLGAWPVVVNPVGLAIGRLGAALPG